MKADEPRQNRIPFMMSDAELTAVDEWRFSNKIGTRAEAIRRLCEIGLSIDVAAPGIVEALAEVQMKLQDDEALRPLFEALAPMLFGRLGLHSMKDIHQEISESPVIKALYDAYIK